MAYRLLCVGKNMDDYQKIESLWNDFSEEMLEVFLDAESKKISSVERDNIHLGIINKFTNSQYGKDRLSLSMSNKDEYSGRIIWIEVKKDSAILYFERLPIGWSHMYIYILKKIESDWYFSDNRRVIQFGKNQKWPI
jgi:hypothetical protein